MSDTKLKIKEIFELLINHPDGVCAPTELGNKIESLANEFGFSAKWNDEINEYEVIDNE